MSSDVRDLLWAQLQPLRKLVAKEKNSKLTKEVNLQFNDTLDRLESIVKNEQLKSTKEALNIASQIAFGHRIDDKRS